MFEDISFRVYVTCGNCGGDLSFRIEQSDDTITVYPEVCSDCLKEGKEGKE